MSGKKNSKEAIRSEFGSHIIGEVQQYQRVTDAGYEVESDGDNNNEA